MIELKQVRVQRDRLDLASINLQISAGQYAILMGSSGSGKSTLLEAIVGLLPTSAGRIIVDNRDVTTLCPSERNIGYVPQDLALFSSMTVAQNLSFGLNLQKLTRAEIRDRIAHTAAQLELVPLLNRRANQISRGQAQRVAIGRAIVMQPAILIMDEPLNSLDPATKTIVIAALQTLQQKHKPTVLHVTHQPGDLNQLADRQYRLQDGKIACQDS